MFVSIFLSNQFSLKQASFNFMYKKNRKLMLPVLLVGSGGQFLNPVFEDLQRLDELILELENDYQ